MLNLLLSKICGLNSERDIKQYMKTYGLKKPEKPKKLPNHFCTKVPNEWNKNPNSWLSDADISRAMRRYEKNFPNFIF